MDPFILMPREDDLLSTGIHAKKYRKKTVYNSFSALEWATRTTMIRGPHCQIITEEGKNYACAGSSNRRAGTGVRDHHYALEKVVLEQQQCILKYFKGVEHLFMNYMNTYSITQMRHSIDLVDSKTFTPTKDVGHRSIYQGLAFSINVHLNCHQDKDFTYCAVTVHTRDEYNYEHDIVAYFAFPNLGLAIPLRPGDQLFFNPDEPHMVSSRCRNSDEVYCVSFYLKSSLFGLNDHPMPLLPSEKNLLKSFNLHGKK